MKNKETSSGSPPVYENSVSMLPMLRYTIFRNLQFYSESFAEVMCSVIVPPEGISDRSNNGC